MDLLCPAAGSPGVTSHGGEPMGSLWQSFLIRGASGAGPGLSFVSQERLGFVDSAWEHLHRLWAAFIPMVLTPEGIPSPPAPLLADTSVRSYPDVHASPRLPLPSRRKPRSGTGYRGLQYRHPHELFPGTPCGLAGWVWGTPRSVLASGSLAFPHAPFFPFPGRLDSAIFQGSAPRPCLPEPCLPGGEDSALLNLPHLPTVPCHPAHSPCGWFFIYISL